MMLSYLINTKKIIDFKKNNLHLISYSEPINRKLSKNKILKKFIQYPNNLTRYLISHLIIKEIGVSAILIKIKKNRKKI